MKKILIVDDETLIREGLKITLELEGYEVEIAEDGREAVRIVEIFKPDVIVTDIIMPEKDGIELILELRSTKQDIKIIAISGGGRISAKDHLRIASKLGANIILTKPFTAKELITEIEK
jgi:YesN/AraC family two-component response regulator